MATARRSAERKAEEDRETVVDEQAEAKSAPNPLWQSGNVGTNGTGPTIEDVTPIFAEARAQAFGAAVEAIDDPKQETPDNVVLPSSGDKISDDEAINKLKEAAKAATATAEEKSESGGGIAKTSDDSPEANAKSDADKADEVKKSTGGK